ncbi:MAG TPA: restriction endonuclease subunit S [Saprospiraceae bacterium]|nr:restriction endonuclease subunit S [Saprospiraceae bacterium]HNT19896.1 restriction endonuclease subunit S [Saprospiraceae bacterium]
MSYRIEKMKDAPLKFIDGDRSSKYPKRNEFQSEGIMFLNANSISSGIFDISAVNYISQEKYETITKGRIVPNDIILTTRGNGVGDSFLFKEKYGEGLINAQMLIIRCDEKMLSPQYLYYFFTNPACKNYFINCSSGSAQPQLPIKSLKEIEIKYPPLPTQRRIASILSAYDDLIENNLKRIKLLEEKAFLRYKGIVRNEKMEELTIEDLANVVMGQSPISDTFTDEKNDIPFHQGVTNFTNYFVEHKIYCNSPIKIAEAGDILFSVRAPVGRINFTTDKICIGRGLCAFRNKKGFQNFFYHQLKEFFFTEDVIGNGAIFNAVTKLELMKVKFKTPSEKIQLEFENEAKVIYNLILNLTMQNAKLMEARDILLPRLMNGEIEV